MRHSSRPSVSAIVLAALLSACASGTAPDREDPKEVFSRLSGYDYVRAPFEVEAEIRAGLRTSDLLGRVDDLEVRSVVRDGVPITMIVSVVLSEDRTGDGTDVRDRVARSIAGFPPRFEGRTVAGTDVGYSESGVARVLAWEPDGSVVVMVGSHAPGRGVLDVAELLIEAQGGKPGPLLPFTSPDPGSAFAENEVLGFVEQPNLDTVLEEEFMAGPLAPAFVSVSVQQATPTLGPPTAQVALVAAMGFEPEYASVRDFPEQLGAFMFGSDSPLRTVVVAGRPVTLADLGDEAGALWPDRLGLWVAAYARDEATALEVAELMIEARGSGAGLEPTA